MIAMSLNQIEQLQNMLADESYKNLQRDPNEPLLGIMENTSKLFDKLFENENTPKAIYRLEESVNEELFTLARIMYKKGIQDALDSLVEA